MSRNFGRRRTDWMRFHCGDRVIDTTDPRHVARVDAVLWGAELSVTFEDTGHKGTIKVDRAEPAVD